LNSRSNHEDREGIYSLTGCSGFWRISEVSPNYHYDSMAPSGPTANVLQAPDSWIPPENASVAGLALRYSFPAGEEDLSVDTAFGKGDTLDR